MARVFRSDALESLYEIMEALYEVGAIDDETMHEFDAVCLAATPSRDECPWPVD